MDFFESSIQNYKIVATSCYIFLFFSLFWLAHGFYFGDSRLPSNKCYQRGRFTLGQWCPVSHTESPGWSWLSTVVYSFLDSLLRVSQSLLNSFLYLGKLHWFPSLGQSYFYEPSVFTFTLRWRSNFVENVVLVWERWARGWDVISCLLLSCVLYFMEDEFEQIITKQGQQQLTAE